jgi:hypothetical protein
MKKIIILVFFAFLSPAVFSHDLSGVWYHERQLPEDYNELTGYISSLIYGHILAPIGVKELGEQ